MNSFVLAGSQTVQFVLGLKSVQIIPLSIIFFKNLNQREFFLSEFNNRDNNKGYLGEQRIVSKKRIEKLSPKHVFTCDHYLRGVWISICSVREKLE